MLTIASFTSPDESAGLMSFAPGDWPAILFYVAAIALAMLLPKQRFWFAMPLAICWPLIFWGAVALTKL